MKKFETSQPVEEIKRNWPYEFTTEEIRAELGTFETEYIKNCTGQLIRNDILGFVNQGLVAWALLKKWIVNQIREGQQYYFVSLPAYYTFQKLYSGMKELQSRREYSKRMENIQLALLAGEESDGCEELRDILKNIKIKLKSKGLFLTSTK